MFCSSCGQALAPGQPVCPQCGRPLAATVPPIPNFAFQLQAYASRIRALSIVWFVYGGLSLVFGVIGLFFANAALNGAFGRWGNHSRLFDGPWGPGVFGPGFLHFVWAFIAVRAALAIVAGWGLMERAPWGRAVAVVAAIVAMFHTFPLGVALGIWTLVTLLGYRNTVLYDQL
jgi:hypothetical protein